MQSDADQDGWAKRTVDAMSNQEAVKCLRSLDPANPALPENRPRQLTPLERMIDEATGYSPSENGEGSAERNES